MVPVPVLTFEKLWFRFRFRFQLHILTIKSKLKKKIWEFFLTFYLVSCFTRKKLMNFNKCMVKYEWKKNFKEGNQIHNFMSSSGSGTVINYGSGSDFSTSYGSSYGSGSTSQKVTVPTVPVPVPQHCSEIWSGLFISDPDPWFRGQKGTGSLIPAPDPPLGFSMNNRTPYQLPHTLATPALP